jgi:hypothetical protein
MTILTGVGRDRTNQFTYPVAGPNHEQIQLQGITPNCRRHS